MGNEDTSTKQSLFSKATQLRNKGTTFTIGNRGEILSQQLEAPILVPHAQQKNQYPYEALFRSEQYALVDNACREYLFGTEFFIVRGTQAQDLFNQIMGKTLTLLIVSSNGLRGKEYYRVSTLKCAEPFLIFFNCRKMSKRTSKTVTIVLQCFCAFN